MAEIVAQKINPIPGTIFRLFQSVIRARLATHDLFQKMTSESANPDPDVEKSNASHKFFIDTLTKAFDILGGDKGKSAQGFAKPENTEPATDKEVEQIVIAANMFAALSVGDADADAHSSDGESDQDATKPQQRRAQKKEGGKGEKGKKGKKAKEAKAAAPVKEDTLNDVPLESYRIIEDKDGLINDYLMAVYSLAQQWSELRLLLQSTWQNVAYDGVNSAVAGAMCYMATDMVKQTQTSIFMDFPDHDSYETVMNTITRSDPEKAQIQFSVAYYEAGSEFVSYQEVEKHYIDAKEQLFVKCYNDLIDFLPDFQKTRTGKPTKKMLSEIQDWDPEFDLRKSTKEGRLRWRRSYTINWLYDLVNIFSGILVQRNKVLGENHVLEDVSWSPRGPWADRTRIFSLQEFAGQITLWHSESPARISAARSSPISSFSFSASLIP